MVIVQVYLSVDMLRNWCIRDGLAVVEVERKLHLAPQQHIFVSKPRCVCHLVAERAPTFQNRPGFLHGLAGVITTLANVIGVQGGRFTDTSWATLIVMGVCTVVCGTLTFFYSMCKLRRVRLDHVHEMGKERAGKHGEGWLEAIKRHKPIRETSIGPQVRAF